MNPEVRIGALKSTKSLLDKLTFVSFLIAAICSSILLYSKTSSARSDEPTLEPIPMTYDWSRRSLEAALDVLEPSQVEAILESRGFSCYEGSQ